MNSSVILNLKDELQKYGLTENNIKLFSDPLSPDLLEYIDLINPPIQKNQNDLFPDGVAVSQGHPVLYFINESKLSLSPEAQQPKIYDLQRILACRGDRAYLARILPGQLFVIPVSLSDVNPKWKQYHANTTEALNFFTHLVQGTLDENIQPKETDYIFQEMYELLDKGADFLRGVIEPHYVLPLLGRALFFRFLCDRNIVTEKDTKKISAKASKLLDCFANSENLQSTSQWLDSTFNGDFLPLGSGDNSAFFKTIQECKTVYTTLSAIALRFKPVHKDAYQTRWDIFDFAHIPIGLLSQVYEAFCWKWEHLNAKETSVYFTPRRIAYILVDEAFNDLSNPHKARVLDPACGAGVFLVLAFRRIYQERWRKDGKRPDTRIIREILYQQLTGFDISDSALKLSALSLYLTAIELDPVPIPPEKLKFKELKNLVLFNHRKNDEPENGPVIGSLGEQLLGTFSNEYDIILSNPPWTILGKPHKELADEYSRVSRAVIERKGLRELAKQYQNPNFVPDLPFLLKSSEWCKAGGRIAMVLPARILFSQEPNVIKARNIILKLITVTGIINGSNLSDTEVWANMSQPFILLFAENKVPPSDYVLRFLTLQYDRKLNQKGEIRIDSKSTSSVEIEATVDEPWLWKVLSIGTSLDIEVIRHIKSAHGKNINNYWKVDLGLNSSVGYAIKPNQTQQNANHLFGLPNVTSKYKGKFLIDKHQLEPFTLLTVNRPREKEVYLGPLVLVRVSPNPEVFEGRALLSFDDVVFCESYYGYSGAGRQDGDLLVRYLHLFIHSSLWLYYSLLVSSKFGAERRKIQKTDLDGFPLIPFEMISPENRKLLRNLSDRLLSEDPGVFKEIDTFFSSLYNLDKLHLETIHDTLEVCLPYNKFRLRACNIPSIRERETFRDRLETILKPFFNIMGKEISVTLVRGETNHSTNASPFGILSISDQLEGNKPDESLYNLVLKLANETGTTCIIQQLKNSLVVGLLMQYRYWTPSRARLLSAEIIGHYMHFFER